MGSQIKYHGTQILLISASLTGLIPLSLYYSFMDYHPLNQMVSYLPLCSS